MSTCCLPFKFHEGTPTGTFETIFGLDSYIAGTTSTDVKVIVLLSDIYGPKFKNLQLIADIFAKEGYYVVVPDILGGEVLQSGWNYDQVVKFVTDRRSEITKPKIDSYLAKLHQQLKPKFVGSVGYCFGAKYTLQQLSSAGLIDCGALAHPSITEVSEYELVTKPLLISAAEIDSMFPLELRQKAEEAVLKTKVPFELTLFSGVSHGFAVKGDYSDRYIRYAGQKALKDQIDWFKYHSESS